MKLKYFFSAFLVLSLLVISNVYAIETGSIPLELRISNNSNQMTIDRFTFEMVPLEEDFPMPKDAQDGKLSFTVDKEGVYSLGSIEYDTPGDYTYKVYQLNKNNSQYKYDNTVYIVKISVVNSEDLSELETHIVITKADNEEEKLDKLEFVNEYIAPDSGDNPTTSDINLLAYSLVFISSIIILKGVYCLNKK